MTSRRTLVGIALGILAGGVLWFATTSRPEESVASRLPIVDTGELIRGGRQVSLEEAASAWNYPVYTLNSSAAGALEEIWIGAADDPVKSLKYASGIEVHMSKTTVDPLAFFQSRIATWGVGAIVEINELPALLIPRDVLEPGNPSETRIVVIIDGVEVILVAPQDWSADDLVAVATSIAPTAA
jgi:hypothetical protein